MIRKIAYWRDAATAGDRVDMHRVAMHGVHVGSLETFTDLRGNPNRAKIIGCNEADDTVDLSVFPDPSERRCGRLSRKAAKGALFRPN